MARAAAASRKDKGAQMPDAGAAAPPGATPKVGQLMAERENIEGQANRPELAVSNNDNGRVNQPLAAEVELTREQVVAEEEQKNKEEEEKPSESSKKNGRGKKAAPVKKDDELAPKVNTRPGRTDKAAANAKMTADAEEGQKGDSTAAKRAGPKQKGKAAKEKDPPEEQEDENDSEEKPAPKKVGRGRKAAPKATAEDDEAETPKEDEPEEQAPPKKAGGRGRKPKTKKDEDKEESPRDDEEEPKEKAASNKRGRKAAPKVPAKEDEAKSPAAFKKDDDADEEEKPSEPSKKNGRGKRPAPPKEDDEAAAHEEEKPLESSIKNGREKKGAHPKEDDEAAAPVIIRPDRTAKTTTIATMTADAIEKQKFLIAIRNSLARGNKSNTPAAAMTSSPPPAKRSRPTEAEIPREQIPTTSTQSSNVQNSKLYEMLTDKKYYDVILFAAGGTKITSHRCVLAKYSKVFDDMFTKSTMLPVQIHVTDFDATTIRAALDFMLDKRESITGKELFLFKFAAKYNIRDLMNACYIRALSSVDASNVCDLIQLAYSNNLSELKQKCLKILVEKRKEIDPVKFADLPKQILMDFARC